MKKAFSYLAIITFVFTLVGCGGGDDETNMDTFREGEGGIILGGALRINEVENLRNMFPHNLTGAPSHRVANQIYEGLVMFDQATLKIKEGLAQRWEINEDATVFTFYLREGVMFQDDECFTDGKGREVTANDFKYCFTRLCTDYADNQLSAFVLGRIKGSEEYFKSTTAGSPLAEGVTGVKVIDDYTLQIELNYPFPGFMNILAHQCAWVFPREAWDKYGVDMRVKAVGTGPFQIKVMKEGESIILERNPNYWGVDEYGNQLPYLDIVNISFDKEKKIELLNFQKGDLDMVFRLPVEMINDVLVQKQEADQGGGNIPFEFQSLAALTIQYYGFQHQSDVFDDPKVRLAFNYAIDRKKLVNFVLQGQGYPAENGIVPPFEGYPAERVHGYTFNPDTARQLLAEAGYPNGVGFPEVRLQLNSGGELNRLPAEAIQNMLEDELGIHVEFDIFPMAQHYERLETGQALFWRAGWIADYPDPENFLNLLYGEHVPENLEDKSYLNSVRYQSARFDSLFEAALREVDDAKRIDLYVQADQQAMNDGAIMPLYYDEYIRLLNPRVQNFPQNAMEYRDLSQVWIQPTEEEMAAATK